MSKVTTPVLVERMESLMKQVTDLITRVEVVEKRLTDVRIFQAKLIGFAVAVSFVISLLVKAI